MDQVAISGSFRPIVAGRFPPGAFAPDIHSIQESNPPNLLV